MRERRAEVWTRIGVQPMKMGSFHVTDTHSSFTYDIDFLDSAQPGLGLVYAPEYFGENTIKRERTQAFDFLPPIQALVPPHSDDNFVRRLMLQALAKQGVKMRDRFEADWEILMYAGHGGIGHIDVFASDEEAGQWYSKPGGKLRAVAEDDFGFSLKEFLTWFDEDAETLLSVIGPTPSVGGMVPKLLLSIPESGWDGRIGLPTRFGDTQNTDIVLKMEKTSMYPGIVELEALALDIHREAGMPTPRHWLIELGEVPGLAIERFDRDAQRVPLFMESWYSILGSADPALLNHYDASYDRIGRAIGSPEIHLVDDRKAARTHFLQSLVMAMLLGNGDLHLMNLSLLKTEQGIGFSPVYDPTPMRAYSVHNEMLPSGMNFGDYGDYIDGQDDPVSFQQAMVRFIKVLGLSKEAGLDIIEAALAVTADYPERVDALKTLPGEHKRRLIDIHRNMRQRLSGLSFDT